MDSDSSRIFEFEFGEYVTVSVPNPLPIAKSEQPHDYFKLLTLKCQEIGKMGIREEPKNTRTCSYLCLFISIKVKVWESRPVSSIELEVWLRFKTLKMMMVLVDGVGEGGVDGDGCRRRLWWCSPDEDDGGVRQMKMMVV
ncbi:hypothetical protein QVD17_37977 [Tagetes erecta]|uniref:Uncharacterized protein n=1 Tax=Tagetes erecta TaxID=13708 RepID=A0AAD8JX32_TARER|nr:hypothetical protein QVD17_37977 [Tagetes erecta]